MNRIKALNCTIASVAPDGKAKKFARMSPKTEKTNEKSTLIMKVFLIEKLKDSAKNPGMSKSVSINIVPASLTLVTIKSERIVKNK